MCTTCGCGQGDTRIDGKPVDETHGQRRTSTRTARCTRIRMTRRDPHGHGAARAR